MGLQVGQLGERFVTPGVTTLVRLVSSVRSYMLLQVGQLCKFSLTNLTSIRLDS